MRESEDRERIKGEERRKQGREQGKDKRSVIINGDVKKEVGAGKRKGKKNNGER